LKKVGRSYPLCPPIQKNTRTKSPMSISFDLKLYPLHRFAGQDQPWLPGLYLASPPRRTARGRQEDQLLLYMMLTGNSPLSTGKGEQILEQLAATYYKAPGSVTAGLRTVVDSLNEFLLDRNVRSASTGRQAVGLLTLALVREDRLYLSQSGPVHAYLITPGGVQHVYDPDLSGRGLGLSRVAPIRYSQASLHPDDLVLLASRPSTTWSPAALTANMDQDVEQLRQKLLNRQDLDLNAVLIQARLVSGRRSPTTRAPAAAAEPPAEPPMPVPEAAPVETVPVHAAAEPELEPELLVEETPSETVRIEIHPDTPELTAAPPAAASSPVPTPAAAEIPASQPGPEELGLSSLVSTVEEEEPAVVGLDLPSTAVPPPSVRRKDNARSGKQAAGDFLAGFGKMVIAALHWLRRGFGRLLPGEGFFTIPASTMIAIAVIVPVIVVAVASKVYIDRGLSGKYEEAIQKARLAVEQAPMQADPGMQRQVWEAALVVLAEAEAYQPGSSEVKTLRTQAQTAIDSLGLITRLNYRLAVIGGLPSGVNITRLVHSDDDLYMLDSSSGRVLRGRVTNNLDFEQDASFQCGPTFASGPLVDIVATPLGSTSGAVLRGVDAAGNLVSCFINSAPRVESLAVPVTAPNWGRLQGLTYDLDGANLYILDPADQAVWAYWGGAADKTPEFFFGENVPPMQQAIDLAVDKRDLYLLYKDGSIQLCVYSLLATSPTRCTEQPLIDARPGAEGQEMKPPTPFSHIYASAPPDPSLYFLEPESQSIYRFSLRTLTFYRQFAPGEKLAGGPATAFTVNTLQRMVFLASGSRVYQAALP
jgi:hypothetical protein